ncbi:GNAT family N-acetyltransferase [Serinicoccus chungangensis]|uniref:GNAT family N-acetyltransferase n=2 Tax=Ornithinimicrobiaceae TaxID=2805590 RepID=UPI001379BA3D|nr:GNAT family N-acetyltransferase [Serinicoccus chungangensis]
MAATVRTWGVDAATVTDPAWWRHRVPEGTVLGPSVHAFLDTADTVPRSQRARRADAGEVVHALKGRVTAEEWVESGFDSDDVHKTWLVRDNDAEPVAAAGLTLFDGDPVDVGVIVAADARGRGHGKHAAAAAVHDAIDLHGIVRWRSLEANQPSRQLAKSFSFQDDCRQLAIRL